MLKFNFRSLFVFFLLTGMFIGQVLPLDNSLGLFEREELRESSVSETKADKPDSAPLHLTYAIARDAWSIIPNQDDNNTLIVRRKSVCATFLVGHSPRAPPLTA